MSGLICITLASGSKASALSPGSRYVILPKQLTEAVSTKETGPGPDPPLLPLPAVNFDTSNSSHYSTTAGFKQIWENLSVEMKVRKQQYHALIMYSFLTRSTKC